MVILGTAKVSNGDQEVLPTTNQSTNMRSSFRHGLENPRTRPRVLIEVQSGKYLGKDDIVRFDDVCEKT